MRRAALLAAAALAACQAAEVREPMEATRLLETDRAFARASLQFGAAEAFFGYMDEDGVQIPASGPPVHGPDAVRAALSDGPPLLLTWQPQLAEVSRAAEFGWTWGNWQAYEPGAGGKRVARGKYVNVWKRQDDGSWKVRVDVGTVERDAAGP